MKKLLALLLALLMPCCTAAESRQLTLSVGVDADLFTAYAKQALQSNAELAFLDADSLAAVIVKILDHLSLEITTQDDAAQVTLHIGGGELLNMTLYLEENSLYLTSPMFSGHALQTALPTATDDQAIADSVQAAIVAWLSDFEPVVSSGAFHGDAYDGGAQCLTLALTDQDIAALMAAVTTDEVRAAASSFLDALNLNSTDLFAAFDEANAQVAKANAYVYVLRIVVDHVGAFSGASLTVIQGQAQVATVSLGMTAQGGELVVGLGLKEQNYWWAFSGSISQMNDVMHFAGTAREWMADKSEAFSYVQATNAPLSAYQMDGTVTKSDGQILLDGKVSVGNEGELLTLQMQFGKGEDIAPMDHDLKPVSVNDPADAALYHAVGNQFVANFLARMIKLLPMDLLMTIVPYTLVQ